MFLISVLEPPASVSIINVSMSSAELSIVPPSVTFDTYVITTQGPRQTITSAVPATQSTFSVPGLTPGTNYTVLVSTAVGYGTASEILSDAVSLEFTTGKVCLSKR